MNQHQPKIERTEDPKVHQVTTFGYSGLVTDVRLCSCNLPDHEIATPAPAPSAAQAPLF
ncbi:MAG: hypothetical protein AB7U18_21625 [Dehalococcoidia bacterium]